MASKQHPQKSERQQPSSSQSEKKDLKEREYRDAQGDVHHHTRTYMDQHKKEEKQE